PPKLQKPLKSITHKPPVQPHQPKQYSFSSLTTQPNQQPPYYPPLTPSYLLLNKAIPPRYKTMPERVNIMHKSIKHHIIIHQIPHHNKPILKHFLINHHQPISNHSSH
ncbi:YwhD family protein, partial [Staphylococcus aureus]|uniref:YwhD family protein n=1 Tax=Staphylococcus aureus TaxID=1280 RepID=UPI0016430162